MSSTSEPVDGSYTDLAHKIDPAHVSVPDPRDEDAKIIAKYPWNGGRNTNGRLTWGEQHDLHSEFLPFAYLGEDMIEVMTKLRTFLDSRPVTKQRVSTTELYTRADLPQRNPGPLIFESICLLHGWWHGGEASASGPYYCNPDYVHSHDESDYLDVATYWDGEAGEYVNERFDFAEKATRYGLATPVAASAYGTQRSAMTEWLRSKGFVWEHEREKGLRAMARTYKTIYSWGYHYYEISEAFGVPESTIRGRVYRLAEDFEPPADPSYRVVSR